MAYRKIGGIFPFNLMMILAKDHENLNRTYFTFEPRTAFILDCLFVEMGKQDALSARVLQGYYRENKSIKTLSEELELSEKRVMQQIDIALDKLAAMPEIECVITTFKNYFNKLKKSVYEENYQKGKMDAAQISRPYKKSNVSDSDLPVSVLPLSREDVKELNSINIFTIRDFQEIAFYFEDSGHKPFTDSIHKALRNCQYMIAKSDEDI